MGGGTIDTVSGVFPRRRLAATAVAVSLSIWVAGCTPSGGRPTLSGAPVTTSPTVTAPAATTTTVPAAPVATLATAKVPTVGIYDSPVQPEPTRHLANPQESGANVGGTFPLRMLVVEQQGDWLKVLLPIRPNGSSGWIRRTDVALDTHDYRILVELQSHQITVWKGNDVLLQEPVGVGAAGRTPTTPGMFFTTELFEVLPEQQSAYGPYAFALSGFSEVHYSFGNGGTGVLGIHGTSDTSSLGRDVSNGCIRMSNAGITKLAKTLPIGVPVEIRA
jgi:lipoprotein-anchoring transpeptidase ErfK/SrfK